MSSKLPAALGRTYLRCLILMARADGKILPEEIDFINAQAELLGLEERVLWAEVPNDLSFVEAAAVSPETALQIIKDCIFLANADGEYSPNERELLELLCARLGIRQEAFERLEARLIGLWRLIDRMRETYRPPADQNKGDRDRAGRPPRS
ncbi:MAG: hypothetical protein OZSIB_1663 [Candidatus Ozemobacter sibiricus]|uniref:Co-chaperone DjlA N-terminal domain-containing protein n=1 Tax=Candidatus Ozemobacter sibiricus TaxID=2268124 RepID=A0A367ZJK9_9BACT|nr:MAG: hypothetical protein OZSIB_1663 [Candidatus Ozemobacter sibiricus]